MKRMIKAILITVCIVGLSSCATYKQSNRAVQSTQREMSHDKYQYASTPPAVEVKNGYYVSTQPVSLKQPPAWLVKQVTLQANQMPFSMLMARLLRNSNVGVSYDDSVKSQQLVSMNYSGTVQGALDQLATQTQYYYSLGKQQVGWSAFETRTFDISFMPGTSNYLVGQSQADNQSHDNLNSGVKDHLNDQQYSNMQGQLSVWDDVRSTLDQMQSKKGAVFVSESTSSVTVTDYPDNIKTMAAYIKQLNQALSKQVLVKVQVLEINLNKDYNYGINWNAVAHVLKNSLKFTGSLAAGTDLMATNLISDSATSTTAGLRIGGDNGTLISALDQQGKVRVVTKPEVVTMNDQIASMRITQDTGYIQSVSSSMTDNYVSTSITPGTVTDGFTLYVLPRIQGNRVYMQISSRIANLVALQKTSTEPSNVESNPLTNSNQQYNAIEVPTVAAKEFNQRSIIDSGSTLIIAGYKRLRAQTVDAKYFGIAPLGGQGAQSNNVETLVLITPVILKNNGA
jgi:type IVB pilus formation R64 PilN family outer membrane protein